MDVERFRYTPLYLQVKDVLLKRIMNHDYHRGAALPSEATLAHEFGARCFDSQAGLSSPGG